MTAYIYTVTAAAIAVSVLVTLAGQGSMGTLVRLIAGVFMALTVLSPLLKLDFPDPEVWINGLEADSRSAVMAGEEMADEAYRSIIKERMEAYILSKAARYKVSLKVEVLLDAEGRPVSVELTGPVSPYVRARLTRELAEELALGEEAQRWIS